MQVFARVHAGVTVAQASRDFGLHGMVLRRWVQEHDADSQQTYPRQWQMKPAQVEFARLPSTASSIPP